MWPPLLKSPLGPEFSPLEASEQADSTSGAQNARTPPEREKTALRANSQLTSGTTDQSSGSATTAALPVERRLTESHQRRIKERGLDPSLCVRLGVWSPDSRTLGFDYRVAGEVHNTKLRRGKGNMPWAVTGKELVLWNLDCLKDDPAPDEEVIITEGEFDGIAFIQAGFSRVVSVPNGAQTTERGFQYLYQGDALHPDLQKFGRFVIATDGDDKGRECRDALAVHLGDERCRCVVYPDGTKDGNDVLREHGVERVAQLIHDARRMYTDEVARIDDIPDPPINEPRYRFGISGLDHEGLRITLPAFMPLIGPYGSGKSVLLRQILCNLYELHGWRCLLTAFEERIKPRYERDLRRHFIDRPMLPDHPWTADEIAKADEKIRDGFVFLRRARGKVMDVPRLIDRIEFAVKVYGLKVIAIDPVNEIKLNPAKGQLKTDLLGEFIMLLKDLAEDYNLLVIACAHTSSEKADKKLNKKGSILTLNDGEDTRYWGTKADIGWCCWRNLNGPTMLHVDKTKDHETMGRPNLFELSLDRGLGKFSVARSGYDILKGGE